MVDGAGGSGGGVAVAGAGAGGSMRFARLVVGAHHELINLHRVGTPDPAAWRVLSPHPNVKRAALGRPATQLLVAGVACVHGEHRLEIAVIGWWAKVKESLLAG